MSLKNAALLALVGMALLTLLLTADFINTVLAVVRGLIPAMEFLRSLIYLVASVAVALFFWTFHKAQSR